MNVGIIELNDSGIRFGSASETHIVSPGIAVIRGNDLLLGDQAQRLSRLHPIDTNNLFWHRLSVEPLNSRHQHFRHHADLAYHQLIALHQQFPDYSQIVFAIPGSFTRDQLSLLLGIVQECPFDAVGLVDSAVAASALHAGSGAQLHIDLQLHQCLLTSLTTDARVARQVVNAIPGTGVIALQSKLAQFIADEFVGQSRFDPLHSASTEQSLYDQIPSWLQQSREQEELILEVGGKTIKLSRDQLIKPLRPVYQQILNQAQQLFPDTANYLLSNRFADLPGFSELIPNATLLPANAVLEGIASNLDHIVVDSSEISFVQSLPNLRNRTDSVETPVNVSTRKTTAPSEAPASTTSLQNATHVLYRHVAHRIGNSALYVDGDRQLNFSAAAGPQSRCSFQTQGQQICLTPLASGVRVNHDPINDNVLLNCGDLVQLDGVAEPIALIAVVDGTFVDANVEDHGS